MELQRLLRIDQRFTTSMLPLIGLIKYVFTQFRVPGVGCVVIAPPAPLFTPLVNRGMVPRMHSQEPRRYVYKDRPLGVCLYVPNKK